MLTKYNSYTNTFNKNQCKDSLLPQVMWHITDICQLGCEFCFASKESTSYSMDRIENDMSMFKNLGVQKVDISGGEPLLYINLPQLCQKLEENKIFYTITTSGKGNKDLVQWLANNWKNFTRIIISIDAPNDELHNNIRGEKAFESAMELISLLNKNQCSNLRINTVLTPIMADLSILKSFVRLINEQIKPQEWCIIEPSTTKINGSDITLKYAILNFEFENILENIKKEINSTTKILSRTKENYSSYWVFHSSGQLYNKDFKIKFEEQELENLKKILTQNEMWLPN